MRSLEQQLSRIDLNLLVSLSVLLKEKNVSRAAEKLFLSQPAMSRNLKKLRELLDDPLFHRESAGLRPTVKAIELEVKLDQLLSSINNFIAGDDFDPKTCDKTFNISLPALMSNTLMFPIIKDLAKSAPNIVIAQYPTTAEPEKNLENGRFDFTIHLRKMTERTFSSTYIGHVSPVIYARKDHPLTKKTKVTIEDCLKYKFVDIILENQGNLPVNNPAKRYLEERDLSLTIAVKSGQLELITEVMKNTDYLLISNHLLMNSNRLQNDFTTIFAFETEQYSVETYLLDHERTHTSQAHIWLKEMLVNSLKSSIIK